MAEDKKTTSRTTTRGSTGGRGRRPARTIDLEAEEVDDKSEADDAKSANKSAAKPAAVDQDAKAAKKKEKQPDEKATSAIGDKSDTETKSEKPVDDQPPAALSQRTSGADIRSFVTHLAAGLVGGLVGVIGAGIGISYYSPEQSPEARGPLPEVAQLDRRIKAIESTLATQKNALETGTDKDALTKLEARLTTVEKTASTDGDIANSDVTKRIEKLEGSLKSLQSSADSEGSGGASPALVSRLATLSTELEKRSSGLQKELTQLKSALASDSSGKAAQDAAKALGERIVALEAQLSKLSGDVQATTERSSQENTVSSDGAALALAFEGVRRAMERGTPYTGELETLRKFARPGLDLTVLSEYANTGIPDARMLLNRLPSFLEKARQADAKIDGETFFDRLVSNAQSIVRVRRVGPVEGDSATAVLSRMEASMKASDLVSVLREAKSLKGPALQIITPWLAQAESRQAGMAALGSLERELLARPAPGAGPGTQR